MDMAVSETLTTVTYISCPPGPCYHMYMYHVAQILWHVTPVVRIHVHHFTEPRHVIYCEHRYRDSRHITARTIAFHIIVIIIHIYVMFTYHGYTCMHSFFLSCYMDPRSYYMYECSMLPCSCYMLISRYWYWYTHYWIHELLICNVWTSTSIVSRYRVSCYQQSSWHVIVLVPVILYNDR